MEIISLMASAFVVGQLTFLLVVTGLNRRIFISEHEERERERE